MLIAFFEKNAENMAELRTWLGSYTIRHDLEFDVLSFASQNAADIVEKYAEGITFAFISFDGGNGARIGQLLARRNPDCYICYYKQEKCKILPLLHSRPFEFFLWHQRSDSLDMVMDAMLSEFIQSRGVYCHESKRGVRYYPIRNILYLQSDLKYVNIKEALQDVSGRNAAEPETRLYAKLSDIERELTEQQKLWCFVRIHKSYLVNQYHIKSVDKQKHTVHISSGEDLPMSEAYYKASIERIRNFHSTSKFIRR